MNDYLCLGVTVPEKSKKYGLRVCTAGVSLKAMEYVRVYPMLVDKHFKRWQYSDSINLIRNEKDNRSESWKIDIINQKFEEVNITNYSKVKRKDLIKQMYDKYNVKSIAALNEERKSLAIVKLKQPKGYFVNQDKVEKIPEQMSLFQDVCKDGELTKDGFEFLPRIEWIDEDGKKHDYWYNSWDAYMHQKKLAPRYGVSNLWEATRLKDDCFALIGNLNQHRTAWLIISIFSN